MRLDAIAMVPMFLMLGWVWPSQRRYWFTIWREFGEELMKETNTERWIADSKEQVIEHMVDFLYPNDDE